MIDIQTAIPIVVAVAGAVSTVIVGKKWVGLKHIVQDFAALATAYYVAKSDGTYSPADNAAIATAAISFFDAVEAEIEILRPE